MLLIWKLSEEVMPLQRSCCWSWCCFHSHAPGQDWSQHPLTERRRGTSCSSHFHICFFSIVDFCRTASVILPYRAVLLQTRRGWASCLIWDEPHVGERGRWRERCCFCCPDFYKFCYFHFFTTSKSSHEFGRADRNVAHNAGSPRVAQEKHFGSGGFPPDVSAGWSGAVQAAAATQTRDRGQSKWMGGWMEGDRGLWRNREAVMYTQTWELTKPNNVFTSVNE